MRHKDIVLRQMCAPHNEILFEWLRWCKISIFRDKNMARKNEMQGMFYNEFCNDENFENVVLLYNIKPSWLSCWHNYCREYNKVIDLIECQYTDLQTAYKMHTSSLFHII